MLWTPQLPLHLLIVSSSGGVDHLMVAHLVEIGTVLVVSSNLP
jgi:hypothetical protein